MIDIIKDNCITRTIAKQVFGDEDKYKSLSTDNFDNITTLDLSGQGLIELPQWIGKLKNLCKLNLEDNKLIELPESIGNLKNLTELYLRNNELTKLPLNIGKLTNLSVLDLDNNKLTDVPESIGNLTFLYELLLKNNQLVKLPKSINKLNRLIYGHLDLRENFLSDLPSFIGLHSPQLLNSIRDSQKRLTLMWDKMEVIKGIESEIDTQKIKEGTNNNVREDDNNQLMSVFPLIVDHKSILNIRGIVKIQSNRDKLHNEDISNNHKLQLVAKFDEGLTGDVILNKKVKAYIKIQGASENNLYAKTEEFLIKI